MVNYSKKSWSFFEDVYAVVQLIPKGRVSSYGAIANYLSGKGSARMVGWAVNLAGKAKEYVPAHRVVNSSGLLTGRQHFEYLGQMEELLTSEGIEVKDHQVVDFKEKFWDPIKELEL